MSALHLIRLPIDLPALSRWAAERQYGWIVQKGPDGRERTAGFDKGRALHHLLAETFGKAVLQPFLLITPAEQSAQLYAYSRKDAVALRDIAGACALPEVLDVCVLDRLATKPMPGEWKAGRRLGFEVRVRPISRLKVPLPRPGETPFPKGAEVDVFVLEAGRRFPDGSKAEETMLTQGRNREAVYTDWLAERLAGAATLAPDVTLSHFARNRVSRRNSASEGPDATLQGDMVIDDPALFLALLEKGVGRHRAYGYGMMLLRPARGV